MKVHWLNTRQKGVMTTKDFKMRKDFAKKCIRKIGPELWLSRVSMYYDGVSFYHKANPYGEAILPRKRIWRKRGEGLSITGKGRKGGNNGRCVKLFVGISYAKGVVMCEQWDPNTVFNGRNYKEFVKSHFPNAIARSSNFKNKLILQDGDPVQKSKQANIAYSDIGCKIFSIPPRSPDINPIENIFNIVR